MLLSDLNVEYKVAKIWIGNCKISITHLDGTPTYDVEVMSYHLNVDKVYKIDKTDSLLDDIKTAIDITEPFRNQVAVLEEMVYG